MSSSRAGANVTTFLTGLLGLPLEGDAAERVAALPPESLRHATFEALQSLLRRLAEDGWSSWPWTTSTGPTPRRCS